MAYEIGPLREDELESLSRFLTKGFGTDPEALFAAPDVLRWKYLTAWGDPQEPLPRSLVARAVDGALVGHVGWVPTQFRFPEGGRGPYCQFEAIHMIDWLGSPAHKGVGAALLRRVNGLASIQYGLGGSTAGRSVIGGAGFAPRARVPVFQCVLNASYGQRARSGAGVLKRAAVAVASAVAVRRGTRCCGYSSGDLELTQVPKFAPGNGPVLPFTSVDIVASVATPSKLNALLQFPRGGVSAWRQGNIVGFPADQKAFVGILSVVPNRDIRVGKIVEVMTTGASDVWTRAYISLREELRRQGADVAVACGSTPWEAEALRAAGFRHAFDLDLSIRDRRGFLPQGLPVHVSFLDADYAYSP